MLLNGKTITKEELISMCNKEKEKKEKSHDSFGDGYGTMASSSGNAYPTFLEGASSMDEESVKILITYGYNSFRDSIKNPSVDLLKFFIDEHVPFHLRSYRHLDNSEKEEILLHCAKVWPSNIFRLYEEHTEKVLLALVESDPTNIKYIPSPVPLSIQLAAVTRDVNATYYISDGDLHDETCKYVIRNCSQLPSSILSWVNKNNDNQMLAGEKFPFNLHEFKNPSNEVVLKCVAGWPLLILGISDPSEEIQVAALTGILCPDELRDLEDRSPIGWITYVCKLQGLPLPKFSVTSQVKSYEKYPESLTYLPDKEEVLSYISGLSPQISPNIFE